MSAAGTANGTVDSRHCPTAGCSDRTKAHDGTAQASEAQDGKGYDSAAQDGKAQDGKAPGPERRATRRQAVRDVRDCGMRSAERMLAGEGS